MVFSAEDQIVTIQFIDNEILKKSFFHFFTSLALLIINAFNMPKPVFNYMTSF